METFLGGLILCWLSSSVWCKTVTDAKNLKNHLFNTNAYDRKIRPVTNQSEAIQVFVAFHLLAINELDETSETLKTTGFLSLFWEDEFMVWNSSSFGGITGSNYPQEDVWKPDVALENSYLKYEQLGDKSLYVRVGSEGDVEWIPFEVFQSTCSIDLTHFPFDQQTCSLKFVAWSYTDYQVEMQGGTDVIELANFQKNSAWDIIKSRWFPMNVNAEAAIVFELTLERKPLHAILTLVLPVIILAILNLFVFALPSDGGEKSGFAVTVFLAFAVFLTIMESSFPVNSETVAYFSIYVVLETVQSTIITIIVSIMIRLASFDETTKVPGCVILLARLSKCTAPRQKRNSKKVQPNTPISITDTVEVDTEIEKQKKVRQELNVEYTWKHVVNALDIVFFLFFLISFLTATLVCLLMAKNY